MQLELTRAEVATLCRALDHVVNDNLDLIAEAESRGLDAAAARAVTDETRALRVQIAELLAGPATMSAYTRPARPVEVGGGV